MQSVYKTFDVLEKIACTEGISLDLLCKQSGYPKPTVHRICKCLSNSGYVRQSSGGLYSLTTKMVTMGYSIIQNDSLLNEAVPYLAELANRIGFIVNLQRRDFDSVILLKKQEPKLSAFHTNAHAGLTSSLTHSACGKVVLSYFTPLEKEKYWQTHCQDLDALIHFGENDISTKDEFLAELDIIHERGFAIDGEGNESGITCIAVPLEVRKEASYAISVSGLTPEINRYGHQRLLTELRKVAQILSGKLT